MTTSQQVITTLKILAAGKIAKNVESMADAMYDVIMDTVNSDEECGCNIINDMLCMARIENLTDDEIMETVVEITEDIVTAIVTTLNARY